jgi:adenylate cyclase
MPSTSTLEPSGALGVRKLIVVAYFDMVGYSRLIGADDAGTLSRLRTLRRDLIDPAIATHGGKLVQTGGDSLLIVFDSIDGAVRCAIRVQQEVPAYDGDYPTDSLIRFRIGINIGDAIADGTDLHGDAVNVAVRIQAECPPGGICVTRTVRDHAQARLNLVFQELGALNLKNIANPVETFLVKPRVDLDAHGPVVQAEAESRPTRLPGFSGELAPHGSFADRPAVAVLAFRDYSSATLSLRSQLGASFQ